MKLSNNYHKPQYSSGPNFYLAILCGTTNLCLDSLFKLQVEFPVFQLSLKNILHQLIDMCV